MEYLEKQLKIRKAAETNNRTYFNHWLPFADIGQPPKGIFFKKCPLCGSKLMHECHFTKYGGFWLDVYQCLNSKCDYAHAKTVGE